MGQQITLEEIRTANYKNEMAISYVDYFPKPHKVLTMNGKTDCEIKELFKKQAIRKKRFKK